MAVLVVFFVPSRGLRAPSKAGSDSRSAKQAAEACVLIAFIRVTDTHRLVPGNLALPSKDRAADEWLSYSGAFFCTVNEFVTPR